MAWDGDLLGVAAEESEAIRQEKLKEAADRRSRLVSEAQDAF